MTVTAASFVCPRCGARSFNPNDVVEGYCGRCHDWTDGDASMRRAVEMYAAGWLHSLLTGAAIVNKVQPGFSELPASPSVHVWLSHPLLAGRWRVTIEADPE